MAGEITANDNKAKPQPVIDAEAALAAFLAANPLSKVEVITEPERTLAVRHPWGDDSLNLKINLKNGALIDALNNVLLPERFIAIWHRDTKDIEVIFTALPLPPMFSDLTKRAFSFRFRDIQYNCQYGASSDRLLTIAEHYIPAAPSNTGNRNLPSYRGYVQAQKGAPGFPKYENASPISFWIRNVEWTDELAVAMMNHLNFYASYYDVMTPVIIVQPPKQDSPTQKQPQRYPRGEFPKRIIAREVDDNLLHYWLAARQGDPFRRFLYNYNIIEYVSFYYVEENIRRSIKKILQSPSVSEEVDGLSLKIYEVLSETRIQDAQKMDKVLENCAAPEVIWKELEANIEFFSQKTKFEGGFEVEPIARMGWGFDDFKVNWIPAFPNALRGIRNALSHGKELKTRAIITPTPHNFAKVQMWLPLISAAAGDVIVHRWAS